MNIDKAIDIKEAEQLFHPRIHDPDKWDANQLSIEALKRIQWLRSRAYFGYDSSLQGETGE